MAIPFVGQTQARDKAFISRHECIGSVLVHQLSGSGGCYTSLHINITKALHLSNAAVHTQLRAAAAYLQNPVPMKANSTSVAKPFTLLNLF